MTSLYPFIGGSLELLFSELRFSDAALRNQYQFAAFNISSCRILIISCKILIITVISKENPNELTIYVKIMLKRDNILLTRASFYISSAGKT